MSSRCASRGGFLTAPEVPLLGSDTRIAGLCYLSHRTARSARSPCSIPAPYAYLQRQRGVGRCLSNFRFSNEFSALSGFLQMTLFPQKERMDNLETLKLDTIFLILSNKNCTKDFLEIRRVISKFKAGRGEHLRKEREKGFGQ